MSASIDGTAIDKVLRDAVDSGGVPHVAAIAADRDGVIYQGAAGPRAVGESDPVNGGLALLTPLVDRYRAAGLADVTVRTYPDARHEILNETNSAEVIAELAGWLDRVLADSGRAS